MKFLASWYILSLLLFLISVMMIVNVGVLFKVTTMSDKSELKAELERKKQRLAQIREEKKRKEEERKKKEVCLSR